jgi:hypothetical protein
MFLMLALACSPSPQKKEGPVDLPPELPLTEAPFTTLQAIWAPLVPSEETVASMLDGTLEVTDIDAFDSHGLGVSLEPGIDHIERTDLAPDFELGTDRRSIALIWQVADPQIIDEESPIRFEAYAPLYRPNGHLTTQSFASHVDTTRRLEQELSRPIDFALLAGDITDGSQLNELEWAILALVGGIIDPDSGVDDDPVPGEANDYNDPFYTQGIEVPWYPTIGNHETNYNGGFGVIDEALIAAATGTEVFDYPLFPNGFRDGSTLTAEVRETGPTPADPDRRPLNRTEVLTALQRAGGAPAGHGMRAEDAEAGLGWFSAHPMGEAPLRLVVLDTVNTDGGVGLGASGIVSEEQLAWLQVELDEADNAHELVVLMSHHRSEDLLAGEVSPEQLVEVLQGCEGLVLHVTGHGHFNDATLHPASVEHGYWELMLASTVDFPMHSRLIELVDEGNGYLSIYTTNVDHNAPEGSLPHQAREQAAAKRAFPSLFEDGDVAGMWESDTASQNLLLRVPLPDGVATRLAAQPGSTTIESETTLPGLSSPLD